MADNDSILGVISESLDMGKYQDEHWEGSFQDYLGILEENPLAIGLGESAAADDKDDTEPAAQPGRAKLRQMLRNSRW